MAEIGVTKVDPAQISTAQVCMFKMRGAQAGFVKFSSMKVSVLEVYVVKITIMKICLA
jgi:hypothetical protein